MRLTVLFLGLIVTSIGCESPEALTSIEVGAMAPSFQLANIKNETVSSDSIKGEVVVLNFWSTYCANCMAELEELKSIHQSGKATVIGVALDEDPDRVREKVAERGVEFPVLLGDEELFVKFDGFTIPYTLVLDESRKICKTFRGPMTEAQLDEVMKGI